ncbi:zinc ribbon domain-containing protein [Variovorax sp. PBL-E5]|uniref:zinc ribbon domain-containing protein n=1 Tax=Variovorax sp. PBL-E5 TaxID=434014 RepID=UPI0013A57E2C|nr:zinc ribbon domain-containing protein [Variovorax sp. PBL-E5]
MFMTTACGICGASNRENAKFCVNCAARLGVEPMGQSIFGTDAKAPRTQRDSGFDAPRTAYSHPMSLRAALMSREPAIFWVRAGMTGLVLLIGFIGWCLYVLTANKVPPQSSVSERTVLAAPQPPAEPKPATAGADAPKLASTPAVPATTSEARVAPASVPGTQAASAEPRSRTVAATTPRNTETRRARPAAAPRVRAPTSSDEDDVSPKFTWVEPSRPNARTSMPDYQDPGPPIVQGPGPRYAGSPPSPVVSPREFAGPAQGADLGPPIAPGPGPRYDFSSPGATPR